MVKVSAIVSTFNSERFIRGRCEDLLHQTLYERGELEIVVVNSGSRQGERYILREYLDQITYIESLKEGIYRAWNRGILIAKGQYITNANADDRLRPDALEVMAAALDANPDVGLVYSDAIVTDTVNGTWEQHHVSVKPPYHGKLAWPEYDPKLLAQLCYMGPFPLWKRSLHAEIGLFDDSFWLAGDYEMWLRMAASGVRMLHIPQQLGLFYDDGAGINNPEQSALESRRALLRWGKGLIGETVK